MMYAHIRTCTDLETFVRNKFETPKVNAFDRKEQEYSLFAIHLTLPDVGYYTSVFSDCVIVIKIFIYNKKIT